MNRTAVRSAMAAAAALTTASLVVAGLPARAGGRPPVLTHISVSADPTSAAVGATVLIRGTVSPIFPSVPLRLQVAVGSGWRTVATTHPSAAGTYSMRLTAPGVPTTQLVRVIRWSTASTTAAAGKTIHLKVDSSRFTVTAKPQARVLPAGGSVVVTGKVSPKGTGAVYLQRQTASRAWVAVASAKLTTGSGYTLRATIAQGSGTYRVTKPASPLVAIGSSPTFALVANSPSITTITVPKAVITQAYDVPLTATGGAAPYTWSSGQLPAGLTLLGYGALVGRPTVPTDGQVSVLFTVTDANGFTASRELDLLVSGITTEAWGPDDFGQLGYGTVGGPPAATAGGTNAPNTLLTLSAYDYDLALTTTGTVYSWGFNRGGQLGLGSFGDSATPTLIPTLSSIVAVSAGTESAYAVGADGSLWAWGNNDFGQLGTGTTTPSFVPVKVPGLSNVVSVSAGAGYVLALLSNGTVDGWGDDTDGQLGSATATNPQLAPAPVDTLGGNALTRATSVSAGLTTAYAVLADGRVAAWGDGSRGALGNGGTTSSGTPVEVTSLYSVSSLACHNTDDYCAALTADGTVWTWGANDHGRLGNGTTTDTDVPGQVPGLTGVTQLASSLDDVYAVTGAGTIEDWGADDHDQLGHPTPLPDQLSPGANTDIQQPLQLFAGYDNAYATFSSY